MGKSNVRRQKPVEAVKQQTKKQIAMGRKEARQRRIIMLSVGAVALVILLILLFGVIQELVIAPAQPVATVNGAKIRTDVYQDLVTYQRYNQYVAVSNMQAALEQLQTGEQQEGNEFLVSFYEQQISQMQAQLSTIPQAALEQLVEDALIREKAEAEGIAVTAADVEESLQTDLRSAFSQTQPVTDTEELPTPTPVPQEDVDELYDTILGNITISDQSFRAIVQRSLLREKVQELLAGEVVTTGLVAQAQIIKTDTEAEAQAAQERIEGGEEFAVVATEVSTDTTTAEQGGDLGWVTTGQLASRYGQAVEDEVFALSPGEMSIVESNEAFYLVQVLDRDENGPLPEAVLTQRRNSALTDWLAERKASPEVQIERLLSDDQIPPDPFVSTQRQF